MITLSRAIANQQSGISDIVTQLVPDREISGSIQRVLDRMRRENEAERRRMSEREIERLMLRSIMTDNPGIDDKAAMKLLERRLWNALKPYRDGREKAVRGLTAAEAARAVRKSGVSRRNGARK